MTAYLLNLGDVLPDDFTLSDRNIAQAQAAAAQPQRHDHASTACGPAPSMGNAQARREGHGLHEGLRAPKPRWRRILPDFARNAHGNLAEQNRLVGAQHGADTDTPAAGSAAARVCLRLWHRPTTDRRARRWRWRESSTA